VSFYSPNAFTFECVFQARSSSFKITTRRTSSFPTVSILLLPILLFRFRVLVASVCLNSGIQLFQAPDKHNKNEAADQAEAASVMLMSMQCILSTFMYESVTEQLDVIANVPCKRMSNLYNCADVFYFHNLSFGQTKCTRKTSENTVHCSTPKLYDIFYLPILNLILCCGDNRSLLLKRNPFFVYLARCSPDMPERWQKLFNGAVNIHPPGLLYSLRQLRTGTQCLQSVVPSFSHLMTPGRQRCLTGAR
jgi:hypothetical protein